jgi:hypothetical protein
MDTVQVVKEVPQLVGSVWPNDKSVISVMELAEGMMSFPVKHHLLDFLHEEVSNDWRSW